MVIFNEDPFFKPVDNAFIIEQNLNITIEMPKQFASESQFKLMKAVEGAIKSTSTTSLILLILLQLVAGKVLKKMKAYFYNMQMFLLLLSFHLPLPINVEMIFKAIRDTVELNAVPKE